MTTTTWSLPVRHPWFDRPSLKRKQPESNNDWSLLLDPDTKRRRCDSLENGLAQLNLGNPLTTTELSQQSFDPYSSYSMPTIIHIQPPNPPISSTILPTSVEEPPAPDSTDVKMSTSFTYEPEKDRIIITSLEDTDSESDEPDPPAEFAISPVFLDRVKRGKEVELFPPVKPNLALVLYRPLLTPMSGEDAVVGEDLLVSAGTSDEDDNAMDVEP